MITSLGLIARVDSDMLSASQCTHFRYEHDASYRQAGEKDMVDVLVLTDNGNLHAVLTSTDITARLDDADITVAAELAAFAQQVGTRMLNLSAPLALQTVHIPKPWGQEIWYSGIEARGVCTVDGVSLAWLVDIFGTHLGCDQGAPMLLKILDPVSAENIGDLYFEMHEQKIEVYVVTSIDSNAWPDGKGGIRYGFNQSLLEEYGDREAFLADYIAAVKAYQQVRNAIDGGEQGLQQQEQDLRDAMYRFTSMKSLSVGDVVTVQPLVPHSLQHGIRVIEFQTPHYERFILSFGQKVLTQDHWDTEQAMEKAVTDAVTFDAPVRIDEHRDLIADFSAFRVERVTLPAGRNIELSPDGYSMVIGVTGKVELELQGNTAVVLPEAAFLNPAGSPARFRNLSDETATFLVAEETS